VRNVLVTGGSRGIGLAISRKLAFFSDPFGNLIELSEMVA